ncbi:hypothetical protein KFL_002990010 [Klebsormidium nitens]|uniref:Protein ENHANCED DISEASE RESISTANCE 2 C-terminal domain-containing protein n=1 Tax=Klebsormidium nitens TaxID=105231 RepID=A0A1Y1I7T6_KLENI|nr:hypothetical protein KFL_002990010 [Klebsormidium nitens]|eukprot:GAQ86593.1 hypothetical protein KFL_002990010 [Klebsormidium nitens]
MAAAASVRCSSTLHVQSVLRNKGEEGLRGACLTCITNGNADKQGGPWRRIECSLSYKSRVPAQSSCWQKGRRKLRGRRLRATAASEAEDVAAQDTATPPAIPHFSGSVRRASNAADSRNCWSAPDPAGFSLRSRSFPFNGKMEPAKEPFFTLVAVDWLKSDVRMDRLARRPGGLVNRTLKGGPPFVFVVNMQVPAGPVHYSMVYYFASYQPITDRMLFHAFMHGDEAYRDARLTLLPNIRNGSWLIRQSVGSRPVALAQVLKCRYDKGEHFFEIDVDMGTSALVRSVLGLVLPAVTALVVDLAFLIRGETEKELPEVLLGAVRLHTLELTSAIPPPPEA